MNHAAGGFNILGLSSLGLLASQYQKNNIDDQDSQSKTFVLPPLLQRDLQKNPLLTFFNILDEDEKQIRLHKHSTRKLMEIETKLGSYRISMRHCIENAKNQLMIYQYEIHLLKRAQSIDYLRKMNQKNEYLYQFNQNNLGICRYLNYRINNMKAEIQRYHEQIYYASFDKKYMNMFQTMKHVSFHQLQFLPKGYVLEQVMEKSRLLVNLSILLSTFTCIIFFKCLKKFKKISLLNNVEVSLTRYLHVMLVYILITPVIFVFIKTNYAHHDILLMDIYRQPSSILVLFFNFLYLYLFYDRQHQKIDLIIAIPLLIFQFLLLYLIMLLHYDAINNISEMQTLYVKYLILFNLQFLLLGLYYWLVVRALQVKHSKKLLLAYLILMLCILITGMYGYIDRAINFDFSIILIFILSVWMYLLTNFRTMMIQYLKNPSVQIKKYLQSLIQNDYSKFIFNLEILVNFIYFILISQFIIITLISTLWFYSKDVLILWYQLIYHQQKFGAFHFILINYFYAIAIFLMLNIFNYLLSYFFANKLFENKASCRKTAHLFYYLSLIPIIFICLLIANFKLPNILLILGGLFLGISFGLKNILMDLFSGLLIFFNRPFELGDLINIQDYKGYVCKIGLLETIIKDLDNDIVILPNQFVATAVIKNYSFKNKDKHAIHFFYRLDTLAENDESKINELLMNNFKKEKELVKIKNEYFELIISPDVNTLGKYQMEIIIFIRNLKYLKIKANEINIQILKVLSEHGIAIQFIDMSHALSDT